MRIAGKYSFCGGVEAVTATYPELLGEVTSVIKSINASVFKNKMSKEKTMAGELLYSPTEINAAFKSSFAEHKINGEWTTIRVPCVYPTTFYEPDYEAKRALRGAFREMDFVKEKLGIEVQFGKYAFMVYNVCAKMTIFKNLGIINHGIEIVPVKSFADEMSSGVSYFEQFIWDLENRGVSNIDIPVMILGIDAD